MCLTYSFFLFFFNDTATSEIYTLSLHDALPISGTSDCLGFNFAGLFRHGKLAWPVQIVSGREEPGQFPEAERSEEHTSELQSRRDLVCRLLLEKKKNKQHNTKSTSIAYDTTIS